LGFQSFWDEQEELGRGFGKGNAAWQMRNKKRWGTTGETASGVDTWAERESDRDKKKV